LIAERNFQLCTSSVRVGFQRSSNCVSVLVVCALQSSPIYQLYIECSYRLLVKKATLYYLYAATGHGTATHALQFASTNILKLSPPSSENYKFFFSIISRFEKKLRELISFTYYGPTRSLSQQRCSTPSTITIRRRRIAALNTFIVVMNFRNKTLVIITRKYSNSRAKRRIKQQLTLKSF